MRSFLGSLKNDRKLLRYVVIILLCLISTLTIAYAALNAVLEISGNAEVLSASWDIKLDNVQVKNGSVNAGIPVITDGSTLSFDVFLNKPGDYYEFTVDVVNDGTIDAMIDSVVKSPNLSSEQAKYILYEVSYANGESISSKQILKKKTSTPVKVRVQYRKDLNASDLPTLNDELNLNITFVYIQSDNNGSNIPNNGVSVVNVVSGDGTQVGDEICIDTECFYVISSTDEAVTMLAKYNLLVGNKFDNVTPAVPLEYTTGIQSSKALAWFEGYSTDNPMIGTLFFSNTNYWSNIVSSYPTYVYNESSIIYGYVENYKSYLESLGVSVNEARVITLEELEDLGCSILNKTCVEAPSWVYSTTYWTGVVNSSDNVLIIYTSKIFDSCIYSSQHLGLRPVITISRNLI